MEENQEKHTKFKRKLDHVKIEHKRRKSEARKRIHFKAKESAKSGSSVKVVRVKKFNQLK